MNSCQRSEYLNWNEIMGLCNSFYAHSFKCSFRSSYNNLYKWDQSLPPKNSFDHEDFCKGADLWDQHNLPKQIHRCPDNKSPFWWMRSQSETTVCQCRSLQIRLDFDLWCSNTQELVKMSKTSKSGQCNKNTLILMRVLKCKLPSFTY